MKDWYGYVDEWFNTLYTEITDDEEFDIVEGEIFTGFDKLRDILNSI
jgi:hypothetical protein